MVEVSVVSVVSGCVRASVCCMCVVRVQRCACGARAVLRVRLCVRVCVGGSARVLVVTCVCVRVSWRWCVEEWRNGVRWAGGLMWVCGVLFDDVCAARPLLYFLRALGYALGLANEGFAFLF